MVHSGPEGEHVYDKRLDAVIAAAELGSFTKAAARLHVSAPALVKQVTGFESEYGVEVFKRSHAGVSLTRAGRGLVEDARAIVRQSRDALRRARSSTVGDGSVRLGISLMCPGRNTLGVWPRIHELEPDLCLEIVPVDDLYAPRTTVMTRLGQDVDVVQTSYSTALWGDSCALLPIFSSTFMLDVPRESRLASMPALHLEDLAGTRIRILRHGNDEVDEFRSVLAARGDIEVVDVDRFDFALFNDAEEHGDAVLTSGAWSGIHPSFVGVPLDCGREVACYLAYPPQPAEHVARFVSAMRRVLVERDEAEGDGRGRP